MDKDKGTGLVIDLVWGVVAAAAARALAPGGRLVNYGSAAGVIAPLESTVIRSKSLSVLGYTNLSPTFEEMCSAVETLHGFAAENRIKVLVEAVDLDEVGPACARADASPHRKMIVKPRP